MLDSIVDFVKQHHSFAITSHSRPDGDALGSELGLWFLLTTLGKSASVFNADPHPQAYSSLPGVSRIQIVSSLEGAYDGVFVLECGDLKRPGIRNLENYFIINIDHHPNTGPFGNLNWVDPEAAAVGEMIYRLAVACQAPISPEMAANLYVAILTDTGSFQFSNTTPQTFEIAAQLVQCGVQPAEAADWVYRNEPASKIRLLARVLNTLEILGGGRIAWIRLDREMLRETGADPQETEGMVNVPLSIAGVEIVAFFRQESETRYRVSLRSRGSRDVGAVAREFGGGGHENAAGLTLEGPFESAHRQLLSRLESLLA